MSPGRLIAVRPAPRAAARTERQGRAALRDAGNCTACAPGDHPAPDLGGRRLPTRCRFPELSGCCRGRLGRALGRPRAVRTASPPISWTCLEAVGIRLPSNFRARALTRGRRVLPPLCRPERPPPRPRNPWPGAGRSRPETEPRSARRLAQADKPLPAGLGFWPCSNDVRLVPTPSTRAMARFHPARA